MRWEARSPRLSRLEGPVREVRTRCLAPCYTGVVSFIIERGQGDQDTHFVHPQRDLKTNTPDASDKEVRLVRIKHVSRDAGDSERLVE